MMSRHTPRMSCQGISSREGNINNKILTFILGIKDHLTNIDYCLTGIDDRLTGKDDHLTRIENCQIAIVEAADKCFSTIKQQLTKIVQTIDYGSDSNDKNFETANSCFKAIEHRFNTIDDNSTFVGKCFKTIDEHFDTMDNKFTIVRECFTLVDQHFTMLNTNLNTVQLHVHCLYANYSSFFFITIKANLPTQTIQFYCET